MIRSFWAVGLLCLAGCMNFGAGRLQSPEDIEKEQDLDIRTVGDVTEVDNVGLWQVSGVGLVTGLQGAGDSPNGEFRKKLEQQLLKQKVENVKGLLDNPNNALVLVSAVIRPGSAKGDPLDVEVTLPQGSKCASLQGGYLQETVLRNYESARRLSPDYAGERILEGHVLARAKGMLLVGLGNPTEPAELRRGRIWEGGVSLIDRPFHLAIKPLKKDDRTARVANDVAGRINFMFRDDARKREAVLRNRHLFLLEDVTQRINRNDALGREEMARAVTQNTIHVRLPYNYRLSPERYLRVVRLTPLREDPQKSLTYRRRLQTMLLDPRDTVRAALRLEALGEEGIPILKEGLTHEHPLVRFASAEALLYLDSQAGVEELARLAQDHPLLRMSCLLALASSDENLCKQKLSRLMSSPNTELRCGAFWALRLNRDLKEEHPSHRTPYLRTEPVGRSFWLHKPAPDSTQLVQVMVRGRAEIALFGPDIALQAPVRVPAGEEFIVTLETGDRLCTLSRISAETGVRRLQCGLLLEDVMRGMVELGAGYPEVVELIRGLDAAGALPCPVAINILPEQVGLERLITEGLDLDRDPLR